MKIIITGGSGYIGSSLVRHLLEDHQVIVYDNLMYRQMSLLPYFNHPNFVFIHGDVRDHDKMRGYIEPADAVIALAAIVGAPACDRDQSLAEAVNFRHVEKIASSYPDKIIIYANSNSGYGIGQEDMYCTEESPLNPISWYGKTKCWAEEAVLKSGGISLRLSTVFGISARFRLDLLVNDFTYKAMSDGYIVLFEKDFKRNYIHVQDVCNAIKFMINNFDKCKGNVYNVGLSSANLSKYELAMKIKEHIPNFSIQCDEIRKDKDKRNYIVSNEKIEKCGWQPKFSLDDGIREIIAAYPILFAQQQELTNL